MHIRNNTPDNADAIYEFWADEELIVTRDGADLSGNTALQFNAVMLDGYWNGGSPVAQNSDYDNLVFSTERIGCNGLDAG